MEQYILPLSANRKLKAAKSIDQTAYIYGATGYGKTTFVKKYLAKRRHTYLNCGNRRWDESDIPAQGIVVLDDLHLLDESRREIVRSIVTMPEVWLIIISRSPVPAWLMPEYINVGFMVISETDLRLGRQEIAGYLDRLGLSYTEDGLEFLVERSGGNAYILRHAALKMAEGMAPGPQMQKEIRDAFARYLTEYVMVEWDSELLEFLMKVSVVDEFTLPLAELITASRQASAYLQMAAETGNFLTREGEVYRLRPVLLHALRGRARQSLGEEQIRTCQKNAGVMECFPETVAEELDRPFSGVDELLEQMDLQLAMGNKKLETRLEGARKSRLLLDRVNDALTVLKHKPNNGKKLYQLIYLTYIAPEQLSHTELLYRLDMSSRHYYRLRQQAITILSTRLWSAPSAEFDIWLDMLEFLEGLE